MPISLSSGRSTVAGPALRHAYLAGTGQALPSRVLRNRDFPPSLNTDDGWIHSRTGIRERRIASAEETSASLGVAASRHALAAAGLSPRDLDLIIFATVTPESSVPSNACRVQGALGCRPIGAFDVSGACTGFVQGLTIASQFIATGTCENVLVVGADVLSRTVDYTDRTTCILFGDGAGAVVLSATGQTDYGIRWSRLFSDGQRSDLIWMPSHVTDKGPPLTGSDGPTATHPKAIWLNGREVFKFAVRCLIALVQEMLTSVSFPTGDRVFLVPHQVNQRILDAALPELAIPPDRVIVNLDRYGNTSAASVPVALDEACRGRMVGPGDHLLLVAFGGGMTWGGTVLSL
ncbi:MAG: beta-ketoacyl-ACP synthase III [Gemmataceae bacterium]